jgi:hypothetical protein
MKNGKQLKANDLSGKFEALYRDAPRQGKGKGKKIEASIESMDIDSIVLVGLTLTKGAQPSVIILN